MDDRRASNVGAEPWRCRSPRSFHNRAPSRKWDLLAPSTVMGRSRGPDEPVLARFSHEKSVPCCKCARAKSATDIETSGRATVGNQWVQPGPRHQDAILGAAPLVQLPIIHPSSDVARPASYCQRRHERSLLRSLSSGESVHTPNAPLVKPESCTPARRRRQPLIRRRLSGPSSKKAKSPTHPELARWSLEDYNALFAHYEPRPATASS